MAMSRIYLEEGKMEVSLKHRIMLTSLVHELSNNILERSKELRKKNIKVLLNIIKHRFDNQVFFTRI